MLQALGDLKRRHAIVARLHRQRALSHGRTHHAGIEKLRDAILPAQAPQSGRGENDGVVVAFIQFAQARVDVAANVFDLQDRAAARGAARRAAANWCRRERPRADPRDARPTSASRGSSRSGIAASVRPAGKSVGMSFRLCTARSIAPASSASSISLVNRPLVPTCESATSVILSPVVLMISMRDSLPKLLQPRLNPVRLPQSKLRTSRADGQHANRPGERPFGRR